MNNRRDPQLAMPNLMFATKNTNLWGYIVTQYEIEPEYILDGIFYFKATKELLQIVQEQIEQEEDRYVI